MFCVQCRELSLSTVASSHSHACCRYFVALGSYRTWYLVGKPWHQRMPVVGVRRIHVQHWSTLCFVSSSVQLFSTDVLREGFAFKSLHATLKSSGFRSLSSLFHCTKSWLGDHLLYQGSHSRFCFLASVELGHKSLSLSFIELLIWNGKEVVGMKW